MSLASLAIEPDEWTPARGNRFFKRGHPCLCGHFISLLGIAANTGAHDVLPACHASLVLGNHMVKVQITALKMLAAILAHMAITLQDILAGKLDFLPGQPVKSCQHNNGRQPEPVRNGVHNRPSFGPILKAHPGLEIMG